MKTEFNLEIKRSLSDNLEMKRSLEIKTENKKESV